jgi:hypothetical protein
MGTYFCPRTVADPKSRLFADHIIRPRSADQTIAAAQGQAELTKKKTKELERANRMVDIIRPDPLSSSSSKSAAVVDPTWEKSTTSRLEAESIPSQTQAADDQTRKPATINPNREKYQFDPSESDDDMEAEIDDNLDALSCAAERLINLSIRIWVRWLRKRSRPIAFRMM